MMLLLSLFFKDFICLRKRESAHKQGEGQRERDKQTAEHRAQHGAQSRNPETMT